jgi:hypothetical protein
MSFTGEQRQKLQAVFDNYTKGDDFLTEATMRELLNDCGLSPDHQAVVTTLLQTRMDDGRLAVTFGSILAFFEILQSGNVQNFFRFVTQAISEGERFSISGLKRLVGTLDMALEAADVSIGEGQGQDDPITFDEFWAWYRTEHGINNGEYGAPTEPAFPSRPPTPHP